MSTFDLICVTARAQCAEPLPQRAASLCRAGISRVILREKDLSQEAYRALAHKMLAACGSALILHSFPALCAELGVPRLHLPLPLLRENPALRRAAPLLGVSVHSPEEAREAESLGASYLTAGHVFLTDCKRGVPARGLSFLRETCAAVSLPVYAIGGISAQNLAAVREAGAAGACLMSSLMRCPDPAAEVAALRAALEPQNPL